MRKSVSIVAALCMSCAAALAGGKSTALNIIPRPQSVELQNGSFKVKGVCVNCDASLDAESRSAVRAFASSLSMACGKQCSYAEPAGLAASAAAGHIKGIAFIRNTSLAREEYSINVTSRYVVVGVCTFNATLYAIQTLKQMLPTEIFTRSANERASWELPCVTIQDRPRYSYRGMLLDSSRHFWSVEEVKRYLDVMAIYKMNRFHWHLTDDQGWRIELDGFPELTQVGAYRRGTMIGKDFKSCDNTRYGGYYTKEQIRDVVAYAASLGITVIPEVDLPGHMQSVLASYPELGCGTGPYEVRTVWGISKQVICPGKEEVFTFLEKMLGEVADMFPGEYFHIGGDECPKGEWERSEECQALIARLGLVSDDKGTAEQKLQNYVTKRVQDFLATKGKKVIGWDEILEGELAPGATVMSWRGTKGGIMAAQNGFDVIMTPNIHCYLDYYQTEDKENEPLAIGGFLPLEKVYSLEPAESLTADEAGHILGVQANLWTEYIATPEHLEYMLLPRMLAVSEVQWCKPENKDFARFSESVYGWHFSLLDALGYSHHK